MCLLRPFPNNYKQFKKLHFNEVLVFINGSKDEHCFAFHVFYVRFDSKSIQKVLCFDLIAIKSIVNPNKWPTNWF